MRFGRASRERERQQLGADHIEHRQSDVILCGGQFALDRRGLTGELIEGALRDRDNFSSSLDPAGFASGSSRSSSLELRNLSTRASARAAW